MPSAVEAMLQKYGHQTTLRAVAVGLFVVTGPLIPLLKPRLPEMVGVGVTARTDWTFLRSGLFWTYSLSNFAMGMGYFYPALYMPSYAVASGMSSTQGALLLALMAVSQVLGQTMFGYLSDRRVSINVLAGSSSVVAAVAVYAAWGLAQSFGVLIVFSLVYGFFGAGYTALWVRQTALQNPTTLQRGILTLLPGSNGHSHQQRSHGSIRSLRTSQLRQRRWQRPLRSHQRRAAGQDWRQCARLWCGQVQVRDSLHRKLHGAQWSDYSVVVSAVTEGRAASKLKVDWLAGVCLLVPIRLMLQELRLEKHASLLPLQQPLDIILGLPFCSPWFGRMLARLRFCSGGRTFAEMSLCML
jgi:hypothetical protein